MTLPSAPLCSADSPVPCYGRREERERGPGIWLDPDRYVWMWCPSDGVGPLGIAEVTHCPHCGGPLPNVAASILKAMQREPLANPDE